MARFATLCSSSRGNATYIGTAAYGILVDAGSNTKQLEIAMRDMGLEPSSVKAIFVTHEHTDHIGALRVFAARYHTPVYASEGTYRALERGGYLTGKFEAYSMDAPVDIGGIGVTMFHTSHDSRESTGYRIALPDRTVGVCTDTGVITPEIRQQLNGCDLVLLESNHDRNMLEFGPYPYPLKLRIRADTGHLSNDACAEEAQALLQSGTRRFVLGHLSLENNTPERAYACTNAALQKLGAQENSDYILQVAPVCGSAHFLAF